MEASPRFCGSGSDALGPPRPWRAGASPGASALPWTPIQRDRRHDRADDRIAVITPTMTVKVVDCIQDEDAAAVVRRQATLGEKANGAHARERHEERPRVDATRAARQHERRERKRRRDDAERGDADARHCCRRAAATRLSRDGLTSRASPCSPTFRPIQNVTAAPMTEPTVARIAYSQNSSGFRAARMMTTKSMPSGRKKIIDESSAPRRTSPDGVRKYPSNE